VAPPVLPPLYAHRLGRAYGPDSSAAALQRALAGGPLAGVETDVCLTADGELVCLHDPLLGIGTTLEGWAHERSAAAICNGRLRDAADAPYSSITMPRVLRTIAMSARFPPGRASRHSGSSTRR